MEAEPTRETRAHTPLAVASMRLRGLLRHPFALRALVIGGLAVAGWLLGAGGPASATVAPSADGNAVTGQVGRVGRVGDSVHAGPGAVHRAVGSANRLAETDDESAAGVPVRQRIGGLAQTGRDTAGRAIDRLDREPVAGRAHDGVARPVRHVTGLIDGAAPHQATGTHQIHGAAPAVSPLGAGTGRTGAPLPVGGALNDLSSITGSMTRDPSCAPTPAAAMRGGGIRACPGADESSHGAPATHRTDGRERLTAGPAAAMPRPALGHPSRPTCARPITPCGADTRPSRPMCARPATPCGRGTRPLPAAPAFPAPAGTGSGTYGVVPPPGSGPTLPGAGDFAWAYLDHPPRDTAIVPARRGVLPPVVRTAADEPALSPD